MRYRVGILLAMTLMLTLVIPSSTGQEVVRKLVTVQASGAQTYVPIKIEMSSVINKENLENSAYLIEVTNPLNETLKMEIFLNFGSGLLNFSLKNADNLADVDVRKYGRGGSYKASVTVNGSETARYLLKYRRYIFPNMWNLGLWELKYNYNMPVRAEFYKRYENIVPYVQYEGNITLESEPDGVDCNFCEYDEKSKKIIIQGEDYIWINWKIKRTPWKALLIYGIMIITALIYGRRVIKR